MQVMFQRPLWKRYSIALPFRKIFRPVLLMAVLMLAAYIELQAQHVSLELKSESITKAFRQIEQQTGYSVVYGQSQVKNAIPVTLSIKNKPLSEALTALFKDQPFTFRISGKVIALERRQAPVQRVQENDRITIEGKVTDEKGNPLASVSVVIPGTPLGTMTDATGAYRLPNVPPDADVVFSYVGYEREQYKIAGRTKIDVSLTIASKGLDEMVIIGYGTTTKRRNTGSVASVTAEEIGKQPVANPLNALQGRVPGAIVYQANGLPGSRVTIQIRGVNSLNSGQQPLYIIDDVPFNMIDQNYPTTNDINSNGVYAANRGVSPFSVINPSDIERIDVLKDADATAIYGTKAANGVVLITTKRGKAGKTKFDVNVYRGAGKVSRFIPMMNTQQYLQMRREAFANDGVTPNTANAPDLLVWDTTKNTDWQKYFMGGTASMLDAQATVSGGDSRNRFLLSSGYHRETTVMPGDFSDNRVSLRLSTDHSSTNGKFNASVNASYSYDRSNLLSTDLATVYNLPPNMPVRNTDGSLFWNANFTNPESYLLQKYIGETNNLLANSILRYKIIPGLEAKVSLSFNNISMEQNQQFPAASKNPIGTTPTNAARFANMSQRSWTVEPQINYALDVWRGRLALLAGGTLQSSINKGIGLTGDNYSNPALLGNPQGAGTYTTILGPYNLYRYNSVFGRINYDLESKYILNINFRRDGSSRFGADYRFGNFGSVGGAWIFSSEDFISNAIPALSFGKLRASYGITGSDQIADYQYITLFSTSSGNLGYQGAATMSPTRINNPGLHWETNKKFEVGLELGWFNDRVQWTTNYYRNRSGNQLGFLSLASQSGFNSYTSNFDALIQNTGWEFELNTTNISGKSLTWKTSINVTVPTTKLLEASPQYFYFNQQALGQPLSYVMRYTYMGVDQQTGRPLYKDMGKDSLTFTPNFNTDRSVVGYTAPKFYGGINNTFSWKGVELSFFFQFTKQDGSILPSSAPGVLSNGNQTTLWLNRWRKAGDITTLPKATTTSSIYSAYGSSTATWGDASFVRFRNATISYNLPASFISRAKMSAFRVYVQGQNLYTWTKNKYVSDPETIATTNQSPVVMPPLRVITAGINCSF